MALTREIFRPYTDAETFDRIVEYRTVPEMWAKCLTEFADRPAIEDDGKSYTFAQLEKDAAAVRAALKGLGLQKGDRVGLYAPNSYDFVKSYLGIVTGGFVCVALPPHLDEMTVFGCTMKYALKAVLVHPALQEKTEFAKTHGSRAAFLSTVLPEAEAPMAEDLTENDPCVMLFTGGTTGKSKGALLSHGNVLQGTVNGCYGYKEVFSQRYMLVLPLTHVFGLVRNLMTALYTGSDLFIVRNNKDMFRDAAMFRPTIMVMVPALAEMCLQLGKKFGRNMLGESMKTIIAGAAVVPPYLVNEYDKLGVLLLPGYGLPESANLVSGNPESLKKPESVGLPFPNQELKVVNGELLLRGKNMMIGYVGEDEASYDEEGWFHTGDLVRFDEEGFLYITGRTKEIIVLPTGENISPAEMETRFNELTSVQDTQVFEDLNERGEHILALEAVPRMTELQGVEDVKAFVTAELQKVNETFPLFMRVSRIEIRDQDFERTPSMKIKRYHKV